MPDAGKNPDNTLLNDACSMSGSKRTKILHTTSTAKDDCDDEIDLTLTTDDDDKLGLTMTTVVTTTMKMMTAMAMMISYD